MGGEPACFPMLLVCLGARLSPRGRRGDRRLHKLLLEPLRCGGFRRPHWRAGKRGACPTNKAQSRFGCGAKQRYGAPGGRALPKNSCFPD